MSTLVLQLKADDLLIINGASMRVRNKTRMELNGPARFLFGKQIMLPGADTTPARRIYYAIQTAYIGSDTERPPARLAARDFCAAFANHTTSRLAAEMLSDAMREMDADRSYDALKLIRRIIAHEDAVLKIANQDADPKGQSGLSRQAAA
jgi:flagellar biosynthesis repressor protein FlbT